MLTITAILSHRNPFYAPIENRNEADKVNENGVSISVENSIFL